MKTIFLLTMTAASSVIPLPGLSQVSQTSQAVVTYASPLADYQPFADEKVTSWKAANDKVGQIGGWRAYAKEAQQPNNTPANAPVSAPDTGNTQKTTPHAGHH